MENECLFFNEMEQKCAFYAFSLESAGLHQREREKKETTISMLCCVDNGSNRVEKRKEIKLKVKT